MFAVIKTGGKQYKVSVGDKIKVEKINSKVGDKLTFTDILLTADDQNNITIGQPFVKDAKVEAKVLEQGKSPKVVLFKYKAKKRYKVFKGHRQPYTLLEIAAIK